MQDRLFLLSLDEYNRYVAGNRKYTKIRVPLANRNNMCGAIFAAIKKLFTWRTPDLFTTWILRTESDANNYYSVNSIGEVRKHYKTWWTMIRPALKIDTSLSLDYKFLNRYGNMKRHFKNGDVIKFGRYMDKPIEWYVLDEKEGLLLAKYPFIEGCAQAWTGDLDIADRYSETPTIFGESVFGDKKGVDLYEYSYARLFLQMIFMYIFEDCSKYYIKDIKLYENEDI